MYHARLCAGLTEPPAIAAIQWDTIPRLNGEDHGSVGSAIVHISIGSSETAVPILPDASKHVSLNYTKINIYEINRDEIN
jgi:hypothetical protein